jgi:hypothetical protein
VTCLNNIIHFLNIKVFVCIARRTDRRGTIKEVCLIHIPDVIFPRFWNKLGCFLDFHCSTLTAWPLSFLPCVFFNSMGCQDMHSDNQLYVVLHSLCSILLENSSDVSKLDHWHVHLIYLQYRKIDWGPPQYLDTFLLSSGFVKFLFNPRVIP